jgi:hypothetical protein
MKRVSQIELVAAIAKALEKQGFPEAKPRYMNAIVDAANRIVEEYGRDDVTATANMGLRAWLRSDDTGLSSQYMAHVLAPLAGAGTAPDPSDRFWRNPSPLDPDDFGRCYRLLKAVPGLRAHLPALATGHGAEWTGLVAVWDELERLYEEELPRGKAPKLYARMQAIRAAAPPQ